jgi:coproporphyrinogen III oxidase-like Fe-S oxidoreductase
METGMVTSVDLLYGLPSQNFTNLLDELKRLVGIGIHGISLYRLNISSRNRTMMTHAFPDFQRRPLRDCLMLQCAEQFLLRSGYRKNHHVHYALPEDEDLYFRHAVRGEDLLALGASASGSVGRWDYLCASYPDYIRRDPAALPFVALAEDSFPENYLGFVRHLMSAWISDKAIPDGPVRLLCGEWLDSGLLVRENEGFRLTATGSWLLENMLCEIRRNISPVHA